MRAHGTGRGMLRLLETERKRVHLRAPVSRKGGHTDVCASGVSKRGLRGPIAITQLSNGVCVWSALDEWSVEMSLKAL